MADPKERLRRLLRRHIFLTEVMQPWFFFAYMEAKSFDHWGRRMAIESELRTQNLIAAGLADGQARGAFRPADPNMTASLAALAGGRRCRLAAAGRVVRPVLQAGGAGLVDTPGCGPMRQR